MLVHQTLLPLAVIPVNEENAFLLLWLSETDTVIKLEIRFPNSCFSLDIT